MKKKLLLVAIGFALTTQMIIAQVPSYVPTNGLVGYWPFNGNANDESGNGYNGIVAGATLTTDRFGNSNSAYNFQSSISNYISTNLGLQNKLTIAGWYKASTLDKNYPRLFYYGDYIDIGSTTQIKHYTAGFYGNNPNYIPNLIGKVNATSSLPGSIVEHSSATTDNIWHQFVVIFDYQNSMTLYIDGILVSTNSYNGTIAFTTGQFFIGRDPGDLLGESPTQGRFHGDLDDFGVWNRALTQNEITSLYQSEVSCQSLVINSGALSSFNPAVYQSTITIYPNPAKDQITIDCGNLASVSGWNIKIFNTLSQEVFSGAMNQQQYTIPLNTWGGQGVYFVKIYDASNNLMNTKKIILQ